MASQSSKNSAKNCSNCEHMENEVEKLRNELENANSLISKLTGSPTTDNERRLNEIENQSESIGNKHNRALSTPKPKTSSQKNQAPVTPNIETSSSTQSESEIRKNEPVSNDLSTQPIEHPKRAQIVDSLKTQRMLDTFKNRLRSVEQRNMLEKAEKTLEMYATTKSPKEMKKARRQLVVYKRSYDDFIKILEYNIQKIEQNGSLADIQPVTYISPFASSAPRKKRVDDVERMCYAYIKRYKAAMRDEKRKIITIKMDQGQKKSHALSNFMINNNLKQNDQLRYYADSETRKQKNEENIRELRKIKERWKMGGGGSNLRCLTTVRLKSTPTSRKKKNVLTPVPLMSLKLNPPVAQTPKKKKGRNTKAQKVQTPLPVPEVPKPVEPQNPEVQKTLETLKTRLTAIRNGNHLKNADKVLDQYLKSGRSIKECETARKKYTAYKGTYNKYVDGLKKNIEQIQKNPSNPFLSHPQYPNQFRIDS